MNSIIVSLLVVAAVSAAAQDISLQQLEENVDCLLYGKTCTPVWEAYRILYPDIIINACSRCDKNEKRAHYHFFKRLQDELPHKLDELKSHFDPEGKYFDAFFKVLEDQHGIASSHAHHDSLFLWSTIFSVLGLRVGLLCLA